MKSFLIFLKISLEILFVVTPLITFHSQEELILIVFGLTIVYILLQVFQMYHVAHMVLKKGQMLKERFIKSSGNKQHFKLDYD